MSKNIFFYLYYLHEDYFHRLPCFYHNVLEFLPSFDLRQVIHHWNVGWKKNCPRKNFLISLSLPIPGKKKPYKPSSGCIYYAPIAKSDDPPHELWKVGVVWANARVSSRISHDDFKAFLPLKCQQRNIFIPQFPFWLDAVWMESQIFTSNLIVDVSGFSKNQHLNVPHVFFPADVQDGSENSLLKFV